MNDCAWLTSFTELEAAAFARCAVLLTAVEERAPAELPCKTVGPKYSAKHFHTISLTK